MVTEAQVLAEVTARPLRKMTQIAHRLVHGREPQAVNGRPGRPDYPIDEEVRGHIRHLVALGKIYATGHGYDLV
jgi:hypothetical protein